MRMFLELDPTTGEAGYRHACDMIARLFGFAADAAPLAPSTVTAAPLAPPAAPTPAAPGPQPAPAAMPPAATMTPPGAPAPGSVAPSPLPGAPAAPSAPPAPAPASAEASPGGVTKAMFSKQVEAFAGVYKPAGTKARFAEMGKAFGHPEWTNTSSVPVDQYDAVMPWFATA